VVLAVTYPSMAVLLHAKARERANILRRQDDPAFREILDSEESCGAGHEARIAVLTIVAFLSNFDRYISGPRSFLVSLMFNLAP
jgi:hypothetical protein